MPSSKNFRRGSVLLAFALMAAACSRPVRLSVEIQGAPSSDIVLCQQNVNRYDILDTVKTDESGRFSYKLELEKGNPDFIYIYRNGHKLASLLLSEGDRVSVSADTLGHYSVTGSEESEKLMYVDREYAAFTAAMDSLGRAVEAAGDDRETVARLSGEMTGKYTDYYRQCVRYVMENSRSLTVVPVFFQTVGNSFYVFSVYPDSKYVRSLRQEAEARTRQLELRVRLQSAEQINFPDLELPDVKGNKVKLSDVDSKAVLVFFWSPADAEQKMFNLDVLKDIYATWHGKGLEIYQVAIATDKPAWERVVNAQGLGWINVCDGLGQNSPAVGQYNIWKLPSCFLIVGKGLATGFE